MHREGPPARPGIPPPVDRPGRALVAVRGVTVGDDERTLWLDLAEAAPGSEPLVAQWPREVRVAVHRQPSPRPEAPQRGYLRVYLDAPLGNRDVVDAASGDSVPVTRTPADPG